jgi:hypothetical protein
MVDMTFLSASALPDGSIGRSEFQTLSAFTAPVVTTLA